MKFWIVFVLIILTTIPTWIILTKPGFFPMHDDIQAMRVLQMKKCLLDLQIPCRWVPDMGFGYGYPQFHFYPPFPYYFMGSIALLGVSMLDTVKIGFITTFLLSGIGMYKLSQVYYNKWGALLSAIAYVYLPYRAVNVYVRGAMGEIWAMALFPWVIFLLIKLLRTHQKKYLIYLSLTSAMIMTSHLLSVMMIAPVALMWAVIEIGMSRKNIRKNLQDLMAAAGLGVGLSAFYIVPSLGEKSAAHLETLLVGYFSYYNHFLSLGQIITGGFWGYGSSEVGPYDGMFLGIGVWHVALMLFSGIVALIYKKNRTIVLLLMSVAGVLALLTHSRTMPIWQSILPLQWLQFPWRFLAPVGFIASFTIGSILPDSENKKIIFCMLVVPLILNLWLFQPKTWLNINDHDKFSPPSWQAQQTISIFDYLPIDAAYPPTTAAPDSPTIISGNAKILSVARTTNTYSTNMTAIDTSYLEFPVFYFPGWQLVIDGQITPIDSNNELGLIRAWIPAGSNTAILKFRNTPIRIIANALTAVSIALSIWIFRKQSKNI